MNRLIAVLIALLSFIVNARADHVETTYHDLIRQHGHQRSDAVYQAALDFCYAQTGADRNGRDPPAFQQCMLTRGYRWQSSRMVRTATSYSSARSAQAEAARRHERELQKQNEDDANDAERRRDDDVRHDDEMNAGNAAAAILNQQ